MQPSAHPLPAALAPIAPLVSELGALADRVAHAVHSALTSAIDPRRVHGAGIGDTTFELDVAPEALITAWAEQRATREPLSVLTEDSGWRHWVPDGSGGRRSVETFDHGGPRFVLDPVDGTRPLMCGLRSAYFSVAFAPPGPAAPQLGDISLGLLHELAVPGHSHPTRWLATLTAAGPRTWRSVPTGPLAPHTVDTSAELERSYLSFFRFHPRERVAIAELEAAFLARLAAEGVDLDHVFEDQYTSNCAQLALIASGTYRMVADLRAWLARARGWPVIATKPYDIAAAQLIARGAGAVVLAPDGTPLSAPLDATTALSFVAYANPATAARCAPHLAAVLASVSA